MLTIVRSPLPSSQCAAASLPTAIAALLKRLGEQPHRCQWIVPTSRRCRALLRDWLQPEAGSAALLPGFYTLKNFAAQILEYSPKQQPQISGTERLLRLARAWQEVMRRPAGGGLLRQLDRFLRDWQACHLDLPSKPASIAERIIQRYGADLEADQRLDYYAALRLAVREISDPDSWPNRLFVDRIDLVLMDGFHRLERGELELVAALARRCDVLAWLVGVPGQLSWKLLESAVKRLAERDPELVLIDHVPEPASPFARLGRSLFPADGVRPAPGGPLPGLFRLKAADSTREVEAVAKRIKADFLASQTTDRPLRLSDVAIVLPGPQYDPLVREIFPRAGLEFNLAGQALHVSGSRPARVLTAALQLIAGSWSHELLYDFLNLPLVKEQLEEAHRLHDLFEHRPRARRLLNHEVWEQAWDRHLHKLRERIARWNSGELALPEQVLLPRQEFVDRQNELADGLARLIESIRTILNPVAALAGLVNGAASFNELVEPCIELLHLLRIDQWLTPHDQPRETAERQYAVAVPWVEYEKDQKAYFKLLEILQTLPTIPHVRIPLTLQGRLDALGALLLAMDSETYQIKTEDDAGVQLFELREIRGLRFRHIYVLGLVDGQVPPLPEEGAFGNERRRRPALAEQLQSKETEITYLFSQLFEAAEERLVLACPTIDAQQQTMPSRFLNAVEEQVSLSPLESASLTASLPEAAKQLGYAARKEQGREKTLVDLWPQAAVHEAADLAPILAGLAQWQTQQSRPGHIRIESEPLLQVLFTHGRIFSPSELETYAACPFRYFGARVLKLEERDPDRTRWHYGSLVHRVLQTFYTELRRLKGVAADEPLPPIDRGHQVRLLELFTTEWDQLDDGSLPPDLKNLFACEEGVLHLFFEAIATIEAEHGNLLNEFVLQDDKGDPILLGEDNHDRPVYLTGKIDRVDVQRKEWTQAIILDYKTGRSKSVTERKAKAEDGRMLQLPLYAAALTQLRTELQIVGGAYIHLSERLADAHKAIAAAGACVSSTRKSAEVRFEAEEARRLALDLVGEIREGNFSWTRHTLGRPHTECTSYCEMKHACRHPDGYQAVERYG